jgi:hypothetical protein
MMGISFRGVEGKNSRGVAFPGESRSGSSSGAARIAVEEPEQDLVDQGAGLEGVARPLAAHQPAGESSRLGGDGLDEPVGSIRQTARRGRDPDDPDLVPMKGTATQEVPMSRSLKNVAGGIREWRGRSCPSPRKRRARPDLEALESRALLSSMPADPTAARPASIDIAPIAVSSSGSVPSPDTYFPNPVGGFTPAQIRHAYGFDRIAFPGPQGAGVAADGSGQTIAIVDAYDAPFIAGDLQVFDRRFGLPDPPSLRKINQNGGATLPAANNGWAGEITLDVAWAHAISPGANILLVEANSAQSGDMWAAVDRARNQPGVVAVSMSWGAGESGDETGVDGHFLTPPGHTGGSGLPGDVAFVAGSGDSGAPPSYPATSPNVLAVGGTMLSLDAQGDVLSETGWSGSGGGLSADEGQPGYQAGVVTQSNSRRGSPDVAYDAVGFAIYDSSPNDSGDTGWGTIGGTSAGAPQWAALLAIVDQGRALYGSGSLSTTEFLQALYGRSEARARDFRDITTGNNGYTAGPGYDLVTGLGSPRADQIVADMPIPAPLSQPAAWSGLGGHNLQQIAMGRNVYGEMEMFAVGGDNGVYYNTQTPSGSWGGWHSLGGAVESITVASEQDGGLDVFAMGTDRAVYYVKQGQVTAGTETWGSWHRIGGVALDFAVGAHSNGALEIFEIGTNHQVFKNWEDGPNGSFQSGFNSSLGGDARAVYVANNRDQSLQVFTINEDGSVSTAWQTNNSDWSSWRSLYGTAIRQLAITNNQDGRLEVFALDGNNSVQHEWETSVNVPNGWSNWSLLGGFDLQQVTAGLRPDGRIQVEVLGGNSVVYQMTQNYQNGGWSGNWTPLGGSMQQLVQANSIDNALHLYGLSRDDIAYAYTGALTSAAAGFRPMPAAVITTSPPPPRAMAAPCVGGERASTARATATPPTPTDLALAVSESLIGDLVHHIRRPRSIHPDAFAELGWMMMAD